MNYLEYKKESIGLDFMDSELLLKKGLTRHIESIARELFPVLRTKSNYELPVLELFDKYKQGGDKDAWLYFFEDNRSIMEIIWNDPDFTEIMAALCRKTIKFYSESFAPENYRNIYMVPEELPYGRTRISGIFDGQYTAPKTVSDLADMRRLIKMATIFFVDEGNLEYLKNRNLPEKLLSQRAESFCNTIIQGVDMVAKVGHISNITESGCFFFPINPYGFTDQQAKNLYGKQFNLWENAYPNVTADPSEFTKSLTFVQDCYSKIKNDGYWSVRLPAIDLTGILRIIAGSVQVSANMQSFQHIIPIEVNIIDDKGHSHKLIYSNLELLHFLSLIIKISSTSTLSMMVNFATGDIAVQSNTVIDDFENKPVAAFMFLKQYNVSGSDTLKSFQELDLRELTVSESIRDREKMIASIHNYGEALEKIFARSAQQPATEEAATEMPTEVNEKDFYSSLIDACTAYVESYTELVPCAEPGSTEIIRCPKIENYLKNPDGSYMMQGGEKVKDFNYVYSDREAFWYDNTNFPIPDLIAFFLSKGDNPKYRELSRKILGRDCYDSKDALVDELIRGGHLCVNNLRIDYTTKSVELLEYAYSADYVKGNYIEKMQKLAGSILENTTASEDKTIFAKDIINYFGSDAAADIIDRQITMLNAEKNRNMTFLIENPDSASDKMFELELGADNEILWSEPMLIDAYRWNSFNGKNPRMEFIAKSRVLLAFWKWLVANSTDPGLQEFRNNVEELFDAAVVPLVNSQYIEQYVLPNWVVKKKDASGMDITVPSPLILPEFEYNLTVTKKGKKTKIPNKRHLKFVKSQLLVWNGNQDYVKDTDPSLGAWEKYKWVGIETDLDRFVYNTTPDGIKAKKAWEKTVNDLIRSSIDPYNKRKSNATRVCNVNFNRFIREHLDKELRATLELRWNMKYNSYVLPKYQKYPLFIQHARYFGKSESPFQFMQSQISGMKNYISRDNSLIMGHEVGFGKTTSAIGIMAHLFETGEGSRPLLCVPNIVYEKWKKEIRGNEKGRGLLPGVNIVDLYNATSSALKKLKDFTVDEEETLINFEKFVKDYQVFIKKLQDKTFDLDGNTYDDVMKLLIHRIPAYVNYPSLQDFEEELRYCFKFVKLEREEAEDDTKNTFDSRSKKSGQPQDKTKLKKALLLIKMEHDRILTRKINSAITFRQNSLVDDLGQYKPEVLRPESIIICTHEAMSRLRGDILGGLEAFAIIDDAFDEIPQELKGVDTYGLTRTDLVRLLDGWKKGSSIHLQQAVIQATSIGSSATRRDERINVFHLPVSLRKLNIDALIVDEIHEFNNIVSQAKKRSIEAWKEVTTDKPGIRFKKLTGVGAQARNRVLLEYSTKNTGSRKIASVNALAIARSIQNKNKMDGKLNNTLLLSATPFVDSPLFQMISVFSIMNYELLLNNGMSGVFDVFNQYACEEWKLDISHDKKIGCFPTVDRYKNVYSNSNLIKLFVDFKISDQQIESMRPVKYVFPDQAGMMLDIVGGTQQVNAFVRMNEYQQKAKDRIVDFLHGKIEYEDLFPFEEKYGSDNEVEELIEMEVKREEDLTNLKNLDPGQIVKVKDTGIYWQLESTDIENIQSWTPLGDVKPLGAVPIAVVETEEEEEVLDENNRDTIQTLKKGNFGKKDMATARTIVGMGADEKLSLSPYISRIVEDLPPLVSFDQATKKKKIHVDNFVNNSPKLYFIAMAIKSVLDYHQANGTTACGQIVYIDRFKFKYNDDTWFFPLEMFKQYLAEHPGIGLKAEDICIITGSISSATRQQLALDFNAGKYKVLLGTSAVKQGVDLQDNTAIMYVAQADYVPSVIMQVEGRGWRQGNRWKNIRIVYVLSYGTLDAFQLSKVDRKIGQIKKMLEGRVFDLNTTQFDKDFDGMKLELEPDIAKRAELQYEIERIGFENEFNQYNSQLNAFSRIQMNVQTFIPYWEAFINRVNIIGEGLQEISIEDTRKKYVEVLRADLRKQQSMKLKEIIRAEQERLIAENTAHENELKEKLKVEKAALEALPKPAPVEELAGNEGGVEAVAVTPPDPMIEKNIKDQEEKIEQLEDQIRKPLRNKSERDEAMEPVVTAARETFEKELEAVTVSDQEAIDWAMTNPNATTKPNIVHWGDLFSMNESGDTNTQINYVHEPIVPESPYSTIMKVIKRITDVIRTPLRSEQYPSLSLEKRDDYQRYFDLMKKAGYSTGMDLRKLGITSIYLRMNDNFFSMWVSDTQQYEHANEKGQILRDFYAQIKDIALLDDMVDNARKLADAAYAKMNNKNNEVKRILTELEEKEKLKTDAGLYDIDRQVERFAKTNVLLELK